MKVKNANISVVVVIM